MGWIFTVMTADADLAAAANGAGIARIGPDLEFVGKAARQTGGQTRISSHSLEDAKAIFPRVDPSARFARTNPIHAGSADEIEALLAAGARILMLPYFHTLADVQRFAAIVAGRATTVGLVETKAALGFVGEIIGQQLVTELHFGCTDLGIEMGKSQRDVLDDERLLAAVAVVRRSGIPYGIAGFARPGDIALPFAPDEFIRTVVALGATRALISRSFLRAGEGYGQLGQDMAALRSFIATCRDTR